MIRVGVPKEILPDEYRVAAVPETVAKMVKSGMEVWVESNAGQKAHIENKTYEEVGAKIVSLHEDLLGESDIILKVHRPIFDDKLNKHELDCFKEKSILIAPLYPLYNHDLIHELNKKKNNSILFRYITAHCPSSNDGYIKLYE